MFEKFDWMIGRYQELSEAVSQPEIIADQALWQKLLKEHASLEPAVTAYRAYQKTLSDIDGAKELLSHPEMAELAQMELTASQGHIIGYLCRRSDPPCARDIEQFFRLSHPTVSGLLTRLEKKGFLEFFPDEADRRCKRIYILEKGQQVNELMHRTIRTAEEQLVKDFTEEEKEQYYYCEQFTQQQHVRKPSAGRQSSTGSGTWR
jgi:DNA-binding MarR family transcriptional regulator